MKRKKEFSLLLEETYRSLGFFLQYLGLPKADVEDMVQEVYIKAYNAFDRFDSKRSFKSWLFSIAKNTYIDWTRRQTTLQRFVKSNFCRDFCDSFEDGTNQKIQIRKILESLAAEEQILIELRFFQELPFNEIAELTNLTTAAVKMRITRILGKMKNGWKE